MLAPTPCLEPNCNGYVLKQGRCEAHQKPWGGSTRKDRLPPDWKTRRLVVLKRDKGVCYVCGGNNADAVDHVTPGDNHNLNNLKAIHDKVEPHCHRYKSSQEGNTTQQGNRTRRRH